MFDPIHKTTVAGTCNKCGSEVHRYMVYAEEPVQGPRGITLVSRGTIITGYWLWCVNLMCEQNEGDGTLPSRPKGI